MVAWAGPEAASSSGSVPAVARSALAVKALARRSLETVAAGEGIQANPRKRSRRRVRLEGRSLGGKIAIILGKGLGERRGRRRRSVAIAGTGGKAQRQDTGGGQAWSGQRP